jgi:hypothetical protein
MRPRWGTETAKSQTCFTGLTTRREARDKAKRWSRQFPEFAPYSVTRDGRAVESVTATGRVRKLG